MPRTWREALEQRLCFGCGAGGSRFYRLRDGRIWLACRVCLWGGCEGALNGASELPDSSPALPPWAAAIVAASPRHGRAKEKSGD